MRVEAPRALQRFVGRVRIFAAEPVRADDVIQPQSLARHHKIRRLRQRHEIRGNRRRHDRLRTGIAQRQARIGRDVIAPAHRQLVRKALDPDLQLARLKTADQTGQKILAVLPADLRRDLLCGKAEMNHHVPAVAQQITAVDERDRRVAVALPAEHADQAVIPFAQKIHAERAALEACLPRRHPVKKDLHRFFKDLVYGMHGCASVSLFKYIIAAFCAIANRLRNNRRVPLALRPRVCYNGTKACLFGRYQYVFL